MTGSAGLRLRPLRALRPAVDAERLGRLLCPPYDVIDASERRRLVAADADNAVTLILPEPHDGRDRYEHAADLLRHRADAGLYRVDERPALYVYEMAGDDGARTRGLLGAVELRPAEDGVVLPHENTMAGPVADRLALMSATRANLEPIYLVYDGGGAASDVVAGLDPATAIAAATTPDGTRHTLWALTDHKLLDGIAADLATRTALIADGHHRYATYLRLQADLRADRGAGPWDFGLTLLVDASTFGPQVHAIHRAIPALPLPEVLERLRPWARVESAPSPAAALELAAAEPGYAVVLSNGRDTVLARDVDGRLRAASARVAAPGETPELAALDVTVTHRGLIAACLGVEDSTEAVHYAHSVEEALSAASPRGTALLLRATPVAAVAAVARAGARMPRKSTLFTPKPASGLVMRRFADER